MPFVSHHEYSLQPSLVPKLVSFAWVGKEPGEHCLHICQILNNHSHRQLGCDAHVAHYC